MNEKIEILVTGAAGFVGSAIVRELQAAGKFDVKVLIGEKSKFQEESRGKINRIFQGDISDYKTLQKLEGLKKTKIIVHSAGLAHQFGQTVKGDFWRVNVKGTENICRLAEKLEVEHCVLISSVAVYGDFGDIEIDESFVCQPAGFYAESKLESEKKAIEICEKNDMNLTILRLGTVIGEGDRGNVSRLITSINKRRFLWIGDGANKKSLIYKDDVAKGVLKIVENKKNVGTEIFNLTSKAVTMKEIIDVIAKSLEKKVPGIKVPPGLLRNVFRLNKKTISSRGLKQIEKTIEKWLSNDIFSGEKILKDYGFEPPTRIAEAVAKQVSYYSAQKRATKSTELSD